MMRSVILGILLFLFIPLVLSLFLAEPLGILASLGLGIAIMLGHRLIAAPFSARNRHRRCLWCGRPVADGASAVVEVVPPSGDAVEYTVCDPSGPGSGMRDCRRRWLGLQTVAVRGGLWIKLGILLPLLHYLIAETVRGLTGDSWVSHSTAVLIFQGVIALTVVTISFAYLRARPSTGELPARLTAGELPTRLSVADTPASSAGRFPFPLHNLTLLGAGWTLWIFRVVGIWWLIRVVLAFVSFSARG